MRVFISHTQQDARLAGRLVAELSRTGVEVWDPANEIYPGDNWAKKLGEAMEHADAMVALVTRGSLASGSLISDIQYALTSRNYGGRVIPVLVGFGDFEPGNDVPWILMHLDPVRIESADADLREVIDRVRLLAEPEHHAAC